jgi:hypothetical protein
LPIFITMPVGQFRDVDGDVPAFDQGDLNDAALGTLARRDQRPR